MLHKAFIPSACSAVLLVQAGPVLAAARAPRTTETKKVVRHVAVTGPPVVCHKWGNLELRIAVTKTEVVDGASAVSTKVELTAISWPVDPDHTPKSKEIDYTALPLLEQQTLLVNGTAKLVPNIPAATNTTDAWKSSLQAAMLEAAKP